MKISSVVNIPKKSMLMKPLHVRPLTQLNQNIPRNVLVTGTKVGRFVSTYLPSLLHHFYIVSTLFDYLMKNRVFFVPQLVRESLLASK